MGNPVSRPHAYTGVATVGFLPDVCGITGDRGVGVETANRQPPAYPVHGKMVRLEPSKQGAEIIFRNNLAQSTGQAINSWLGSPAAHEPARKGG